MTDKNKEALEALDKLLEIISDGQYMFSGSKIAKCEKTIRAALTQNEVTDDEVREAVKYIRKFTNDPSYITTSFIKHLETLITAATRKPEKEWQPIESAPNDGSEILVYGGKLYGEVNDLLGNSAVAKVKTTNGAYFSVCDTDVYACYIDKPTHWMPLPRKPRV